LYEKLYLSRQGYKPDPKIIHEMLHVIRKKLKPHGINIETVYDTGYTLQAQGGNRYKGVKLTKNQGTIVDMLFTTNGICTKESLYEKLYLSRQGYKPDRKIIREMLCVIRKKLEPYGVNIETVYDVGYTMTSEGKARLSGLIQQT
jgi:DNA-binding response OmpR family regulator